MRAPRLLPAGFAADERGSVLALSAVTLGALLATLALAADLGRLYLARAEAQRAADAAALAGAGALAESDGDAARARRIATELAARNAVAGLPVQLAPEDVATAPDSVAVTVRRAASRGTAVPTLFARLFGIDAVDVAGRAVAAVTGTSAAVCLKPFIVPDAWDDANRNGRYDAGELYDAVRTGYGTAWRNDGYVRDFGRPITLYPGTTGTTLAPSWYFLMRMPTVSGGDIVRQTIASTTCQPGVARVGDVREVDQEPGAKTGPVSQGINDLIAQDPGAAWNATTRSVVGSAYGDAWRASPRLINIALFDPREPVQPGMKPITVTNFATVFLEKSSGGAVIGRLISVMGAPEGSGCGTAGKPCAPFARSVRLAQ